MSQNLLFDIKIPEGYTVKFEQESSFENFIGQFQLFCPKLLCIIDGTCLRYYDKPGTLPTNIRFDYKQRRGNLTEYYFRDIGNDSLYCVFGHEAAKIFYPRIDEVDPTNSSELITPLPKSSTLPRLEVESNNLNRKIADPRLIITSSHSNNITQRDNKPVYDSKHPIGAPISRHSGSSQPSSQTSSENRSKRPVILQPLPKNEKHSFQKDAARSVSDRSHPPDQIIIIDKGVKLIFPNVNYPLEVRTHHPSI